MMISFPLGFMGIKLDPAKVWEENNKKQGSEYKRKNGCLVNTGSKIKTVTSLICKITQPKRRDNDKWQRIVNCNHRR
jgi:hypothetical protein